MRRAAATVVVLVCALMLSGCGLQFSFGFGFGTGSDGRFDGNEITVPVLYTSGAEGVVATQRITATDAGGDGLSVQISENDVSGVDAVTESATWTAVTAVTLLTGARPDTAYTFAFDTRPATPAAGAVTAVGVLALYYGTEVQPGVALTGALTPFGAIRPVAGLAEQVTAAVDAGGIDTILVPAGQRVVLDAQGRTVDLDQLAATGGMTIAEVADVATAYSVMTGEDLPEAAFPTPPASPAPAPTGDADIASDDALGPAVDEIIQGAEDSFADVPESALGQRARAAIARAETLREEGDVAAAFAAAVTAADRGALAASAQTSATAATAVATRTREDAAELLDDLTTRSATTLDDVDALLRAAAAAGEAYALGRYAEEVSAAASDEASAAVATTAALLAESSLRTARAVASLPGGGGGGVSSEADLTGAASLLRRAGVAASDAYRARVVSARAATDDVSAERAAVRLAAADPAVLRALAFDRVRDELRDRAPDDRGWAALGTALAGYTRVAPVLAAGEDVPSASDPDAEDAALQRTAVADGYAVSAIDALTSDGAAAPFARGELAEARSAATVDPAAGADRYVTAFVTARLLAFAGGIERS